MLAFTFLVFALGASAALRKPRAITTTTTPTAPACTTNSDVVVNGGFYGYPNPPSYAPFSVTSAGGSPGCEYVNGYTPCLGQGGFGAGDPNCLAKVGCWGHGYLNGNYSSGWGTPHVYFRVTLDHTIVIPSQLSCPHCTSGDQPGCAGYPSQQTMKVVTGTVVGPASGQGTLKVIINQSPQTTAVAPLIITAVRMITPGTSEWIK
ncbi:MAG: hypothetical protein LQ351_005198 [Letrouitia transgressa]|nr:MAG: hypothetical protein LQ351_005198 [Letrouitia transgressa]